MGLIIKLLVNTFAILITGYLLKDGVHVDNFTTAFLAALTLGVVNIFIKPIISIFALPFTILTLGLFTFVINGLLILLVSNIVPGFTVNGFLWAILFSLVFSIVNSVLQIFIK